MSFASFASTGFSWNALLGGVFPPCWRRSASMPCPCVRETNAGGAWPFSAGGLATASAMFVSGELGRTVLLKAAAFAAVALSGPATALTRGLPPEIYLALLIMAAIAIAAGLGLAGEGAAASAEPLDHLAVAFLVIGFGLKLALVPFYFWPAGVANVPRP